MNFEPITLALTEPPPRGIGQLFVMVMDAITVILIRKSEKLEQEPDSNVKVLMPTKAPFVFYLKFYCTIISPIVRVGRTCVSTMKGNKTLCESASIL